MNGQNAGTEEENSGASSENTPQVGIFRGAGGNRETRFDAFAGETGRADEDREVN